MCKSFFFYFSILALLAASSCQEDRDSSFEKGVLQLISISVGSQDLSLTSQNSGAALDEPIVIRFSESVDTTDLKEKIVITDANLEEVITELSYLDERKTISIRPSLELKGLGFYTLNIAELLSTGGDKIFTGITASFTTQAGALSLTSITVNTIDLDTDEAVQNVPRVFEIKVDFSHALDPEEINNQSVQLFDTNGKLDLNLDLNDTNESLIITGNSPLAGYTRHRLSLSDQISTPDGRVFDGFDKLFYTALDSTLKFPEITDEELLTKVQEQTFKYFYDLAHPVSGLNRERITSEDNVTIGGSGFGVMTIIVGIERGFITRQEGVERLEKITDFLETKAERFHGVWSHWLSGSTGKVNRFSANDDGADLVETSFMIQGLITVRQYLNGSIADEQVIIDRINRLVDEVEWDWFQQGGQNQLYWHWSPNFGFEKNLAIRGWNESLIVYVLAASSTTHTIGKEVYENGWAGNGSMQNTNGNTFYDLTLPLRPDRGGPLFFSHYSFLGIDPRNLSDQYADYWEQNVTHTKLNRAYCIDNPKNYLSYSELSWGLTASDGDTGYSAHSPDNDRGVITPTAALSSFPYTPEESMQALRYFYYILGDKLWGEYGFYDAFNATEGWYANSYLAIDQGPIIIMIENHRSKLLWNLFMSAPEVQDGLDKLGFTY